MTLTEDDVFEPESMETISPGKGRPELSLEWRDMTIHVRYCGNTDDELEEYFELWPKMSDRLFSAACLQDRRQKRKELGERAGGQSGGHTLAQLLKQNCDVNSGTRREGSLVGSSTGATSEVSSQPEDDEEEDESNVVPKPDDCDLPETHHDSKMSRLIALSSTSKGCHICGKVFGDHTRIKRHLLSHSKEKPFKCHICGWGFHQKCNMERHLASHTREGEGHACPRCNSWFTTKSVLSLHLKDAHNEKYIGKRDLVGGGGKKEKAANNEVKLEVKQETETQALKYEPLEIKFPTIPGVRKGTFGPNENNPPTTDDLTCHLCGKTFVKKTNLKHHLMLHRGEKPWKCHICAYRFVQKCNLKKHIETHSTGTYHCPQCSIRFASKGAVAGHMSIVHLGTEEDAPGNTITDEMAEDEETEIPAPQEKSVVPEPKKINSPAMLWWKHAMVEDTPPPPVTTPSSHTDQTPKGPSYQKYQSPSISITPKTPVSIPKIASNSAKSDATTLVCSKCNKNFTTKADLDKHMLIHNAGTKPYACPVCGWRFHLIHNMKRHLNTHEESGDIEAGTADELLAAVEATATRPTLPTAVSPLPASVDGMVSPISMTSSTTTEGQESPSHLRCNICSKTFTEAVALSRHMEVHSADRPFACPICGWRFKQMQNMKRHMLTHSGAKPYSCDFCDKSYTDNYSLKQHVAKIHPGVASSIPNLLINPNRTKKSGPNAREESEEGFKSMVNEMTTSQKTGVLKIYNKEGGGQAREDNPKDFDASEFVDDLNGAEGEVEEEDYEEEEEEEVETEAEGKLEAA